MRKKIITSLIFMLIAFCMTEGIAYTGRVSRRKKTETVSNKKKKVKYVKSKEGIKTLVKFSRSRKKMVEELKDETKSYERIKKASAEAKLKKGVTASFVKNKYGKPVIVLPENGGKNERWVYKRAAESYFTGEKVYLIFDENKRLIKCEECQGSMDAGQ